MTDGYSNRVLVCWWTWALILAQNICVSSQEIIEQCLFVSKAGTVGVGTAESH